MRRFSRLVSETFGGLAEWSKAAVLKTVEPRGSRGSNPWPTAIQMKAPCGVLFFCINDLGPGDPPNGFEKLCPEAKFSRLKAEHEAPVRV